VEDQSLIIDLVSTPKSGIQFGMRLKVSHATAREKIMSQAEEGFALKYELEAHGYGNLGMINNGALKATVEHKGVGISIPRHCAFPLSIL
jgi:hypothetical protein